MSNNVVWKPLRKFPGYEISATWLVRNARTKRLIPQSLDRYCKAHVTIIRKDYPIEVFVSELVYNEFPEQRTLVLVS